MQLPAIVPPPHGTPWPEAMADEAGMNWMWLEEAARFAAENEIAWPIDLRLHLESGYFDKPPHNEVLGPIRPRGPANGLVLRRGYKIAAWGETDQVDFTFSQAKSYLSLLAGIAVMDGLIPDLDAPVRDSVDDGGFDSAQNRPITWRQLLQNTSEWEGTLFGKSDVIDRGRNLAVEGQGRKGEPRPLHPPGTYWEYNDVRVNRLSLALLRRFRRPLPEVFAERIMRPIGASSDWSWHGYSTSMVAVDGRMIESVSGGTHWGGGMLIHAEDQARIGLLMQRRGEWAGRRILPERWIGESLTPCALNKVYGLLWWLNTGHGRYPHAPEDSFFAVGAGGNLTWVAPTQEIVAVLRWEDPTAIDTFIRFIMQALEQ
ncbi:serine hydrolase domain-containing protein [Rhodopila sp.]|jgi:CubicO group peptidase (beta-lactamase class C family)|uniref:serine hydrolase domain-containing protein n=1 Tax=Rhodopila sp. TaxID=2480087 RepID=UPI002D1CB9F1|nr:serine hydrolase [Rhodopila sp.]HVZ07801.1 serine hydrolase [Rhodopila sp.]